MLPQPSLITLLTVFTTAPFLTITEARIHVQVNPKFTYQTIDGLGITQSFQRAKQIYGSDGLSPKNSQRVLDLLFSNTTGAGLTILRNGIGSSGRSGYDTMKSIAPWPPGVDALNRTTSAAFVPRGVAPPQPNPHINRTSSIPIERWNVTKPGYLQFEEGEEVGSDSGQLRLTWDALGRGLETVYADAWSAPGWMKENMDEGNGGRLCGVTGAEGCKQGDMRQQYADYLVMYLKYWKQAGVRVDYVGFLSEPDRSNPKASMLSTGQQAADFLKILAPTLRASGLTTKIACCDGSGWESSRKEIAEIRKANAEQFLDIATSHGYTSPPSTPLDTHRRVWQSEWADLSSGFENPFWWFNGSEGEGLTWAIRIQQAFVKSNASAFLGKYGASNDTRDNSALVQISADSVVVTKRLWAFAQYSRFVRPGAVRLDAKVLPPSTNVTTTRPKDSVYVSAFKNKDGIFAVQVINNGDEDDCVQIDGLDITGAYLRRYLTNDDYDLSKMNIDIHGKGEECVGSVTGAAPARSMVSFVIERLVPIGP